MVSTCMLSRVRTVPSAHPTRTLLRQRSGDSSISSLGPRSGGSSGASLAPEAPAAGVVVMVVVVVVVVVVVAVAHGAATLGRFHSRRSLSLPSS